MGDRDALDCYRVCGVLGRGLVSLFLELELPGEMLVEEYISGLTYASDGSNTEPGTTFYARHVLRDEAITQDHYRPQTPTRTSLRTHR